MIPFRYSKTEEKLSGQAKSLLNVVEHLSEDTTKLHDKLDTVKTITKNNTETSTQFQNSYIPKLQSMGTNVFNQIHTQNNLIKQFMDNYLKKYSTEQSIIETLQSNLLQLDTDSQNHIKELEKQIIQSYELNKSNNETFKISIQDILNNYYAENLKFTETVVLKSLENYKEISKDNLKRYEKHSELIKTSVKNTDSKTKEFAKEISQHLMDLETKMIDFKSNYDTVLDETREFLLSKFQQIDSLRKENQNFETDVTKTAQIVNDYSNKSDQMLKETVTVVDLMKTDIKTSINTSQDQYISLIHSIQANEISNQERVASNLSRVNGDLHNYLKQSTKFKDDTLGELETLNGVGGMIKTNVMESSGALEVLQREGVKMLQDATEVNLDNNNCLREFIQNEVLEHTSDFRKFINEEIQLEYKATGKNIFCLSLFPKSSSTSPMLRSNL